MTLTLSSARPVALALVVACCVLWTESLVFGQTYRPFKDILGRFDLEYPTKDWSPLPAAGSAAAILIRNDRSAIVVIDLSRLTEPLSDSDIAANARIELESLKAEQPQAREFTSETLDTKAGKASVIRFTRMGAIGPERVIRCLVAVGHELYRLDAVTAEAAMPKHQATLMHMILSFRVPAASGSPKN